LVDKSMIDIPGSAPLRVRAHAAGDAEGEHLGGEL